MRAIIPIFMERKNVLLSTKKDVIDFQMNKNNFLDFSLALLSKDYEQFFYGYAEDEAVEEYKSSRNDFLNDKNKTNELNIIVDNELNRISNENFLYSKEYVLNNEFEYEENDSFYGYHKQRSFLYLQNDINLTKNINFSYLTFSNNSEEDGFIYIKKGATITIDNVMFDGITIVVEDGANLIISNSYFHGVSVGIIQKGLGKIEKKNELFFEGVNFNFHIDNASSVTLSSNIINVEEPSSIVNFYNTSRIDNIHFNESIDFGVDFSSVILENRTIFRSLNDEAITIQFDELFLRSEFHVDSTSNIILYSNKIHINSIEERTYSFGIFFGRIAISDSNIMIRDTQFISEYGFEDEILYSESSVLKLINCLVLKNTIFATAYNSVCNFESITFENNKKIFIVKAKKRDNEAEEGSRKSEFSIEKSIFKNNNSILNTGNTSSFISKENTYINNKYGYKFAYNQEIVFYMDNIKQSERFLHGTNINALIKQTDISECLNPIFIENQSRLDVLESKILDSEDISLDIKNSILTIEKSLIRKNKVGVHISGEDALMFGEDFEIELSRKHNVEKKFGADIVNATDLKTDEIESYKEGRLIFEDKK
jgi:hypothetical protein